MERADVIVVGGGLGGLVLAALLMRQGREVLVLEAEQSPHARTQGGTLDLHPESGLAAIGRVGLTDRAVAAAVPLGEHHRIADRDGVVLVDMAPPEEGAPGRPEVDRGELRAMLLEEVGPECLRWGARVDRAMPIADGWRVDTARSTYGAGLLVGADGAWSCIRQLLSNVVPKRLGAVAVDLGIVDLAADRALAEAVGPGAYWAVGAGSIVSAQAALGGGARVYLTLAEGGDALSDDVSRCSLLERFASWGSTPRALIGAGSAAPVVRRLAALPVGFGWEARPGITLIGDAAHLMPPVGEGANQAMLDAVVLSDALARHDGVDAAITAYEQELAARIRPVALESERIHRMITAPDAIERLAEMFGQC